MARMAVTRSVKWRITAITVAAFIASTSVLVFLVNRESTAVAKSDAARYAKTLTRQEAGPIDRKMNLALRTTADMADMLEMATARHSMSRPDVIAMVETVLRGHPEFVGSTATFEPNAFDGKDANFRNAPAHDRTGRLLPYAFWAAGAVKVAAVSGYDDVTAAGDWYNVPRRTLKSTIVDPYVYPVNGVDVLMTTVATPMIVNGRFVGVTTLDISLASIQTSIAKIKPFGTGYAALVSSGGYLVAYPKAQMLNKSAPKDLALLIRDAKNAAAPATRQTTDDLTSTPSLQYAVPIPIASSSWTLITSSPLDSVLKDARALRNKILLLAAAGMIMMTVLSLALGARIAAPLRAMAGTLHRVEGGDLTPRFTAGSGSEIAAMANALNATLEQTGQTITAIRTNASLLASSSSALLDYGGRIGQLASSTAERSTTASTTANQVSADAQTAAHSADEVSRAIRSIAASASDAAAVAGTAASQAAAVNETVSKLGRSSAAIGEIVKVITSIAGQTNLLALNATIEAARAGDRGKGFAVVAHEVKELARQTAEATSEIARMVDTIQTDTRDAVDAIGGITAVIDRINNEQGAIASTITEQVMSTTQISATVADAATSSAAIAANIHQVAAAAAETTQGVEQILTLVGSLSAMADDLQESTRQFTTT